MISPLLSPFLLIAHLAPVQARTTCFKSIRAKPLFLETLFLTEFSFYGTISLRSFVTVRLFHPLNSSSIFQALFQGFFTAVNLELSFETQSSHQSFSAVKMKLFELNS
jgi:hypothetical protein